MTEILTESFCERCGTRYTFESAAPASRRLGGLKVLGRGLKQFVMSDSTSLDEAIASARSEVERDATNQQLDAFHRTFSFCLGCRQYTCANCWNEAEARCQSCAPLAIVQDDPYASDGRSFDDAGGLIGDEPTAGHAHGSPVDVPSSFADAWAAPPPIEFQAAPGAGTPRLPDATIEAAPAPDPVAMDGIWIGAPEADAPSEVRDAAGHPTAAAALDDAAPLVAAGDDAIDPEDVAAWAHRPMGAYFTAGPAARSDEPGADIGGAAGADVDATPDRAEAPIPDAVVDHDPEAFQASGPTVEPFMQASTEEQALTQAPAEDASGAPSPSAQAHQGDRVPQPAWPAPILAPSAVPAPEPAIPAEMPDAVAAEAPSSEPEPVAPATPAFPPIATPAVPPIVPPVLPEERIVPAASAPWPASDVATPPPGPVAPLPPETRDRPSAPPQWPTGPRWPTGNRPADAASPAVDALAALIARKTTDAMWAASNRQILQPVVETTSVAAVKACGSCGTSLSANARFCRRCGTPQA